HGCQRRSCLTSGAGARDELALDRQLRGGKLHRPLRQRLGYTLELEHDAARLHHGHPPLRIALPLPHPNLEWLLRDRLVGEDADPDLPATLDVTGHRDTRGLDRAARDPAPGHRLQSVIAERNGVAAVRLAAHPPLHLLPILDSLRGQHMAILSDSNHGARPPPHFGLQGIPTTLPCPTREQGTGNREQGTGNSLHMRFAGPGTEPGSLCRLFPVPRSLYRSVEYVRPLRSSTISPLNTHTFTPIVPKVVRAVAWA